jgi:transcriptional regulator with XRE-family HTH domain
MDAARALRDARLRAGLSQAELARRAGTSQATVCAYETGRKQPALSTLERLLAGAGARLAVEAGPSGADLERAAATLADVLALAEALPARHADELRYPRLPVPS